MENKEENKKEDPKKEETKKEDPKKEEPKKEETKVDTKNEENAVEDKPVGDDFEVPVKKEIDKEIGITNMVGDNIKFSEAKTWDSLGVKESIQKGLLEMDFLNPSKIQATTFPQDFQSLLKLKMVQGKQPLLV